MTTEDFQPTHVVPGDGLPAWEAPDVSRPTEPLDPLLPVRLIDRRGDWSHILCANGWRAWVDGRLLLAVPRDPPAAGLPPARTADPRPLLTRTGDSLARYRQAAEELAAGRIDGETFRRRTRGLRVGVVVEGESVWLYDADHGRWVYGDGRSLSTFAVSAGPAGAVPGAPEAADGPEGSPDTANARDTPEPAAHGRPGPSPDAGSGAAARPPVRERTAPTRGPGPDGARREPTRVVDPARPEGRPERRAGERPGAGDGGEPDRPGTGRGGL
ncbi:hypothetical protein [Streptomyces sp. NPDC001985]|uniref:hypothetical protein n=1 Tax=Streptomyces sp. NPDC001985 TaxID=3154406 RepID=UPI00332EFB93